jgi:NAD(P)-dependent dehydrogenase (short-subunit alcohol dehydrogenase family)
MESLSGKVIMVTGATDGLGKATALELARRGATLLLHGRNPKKGQALLNEIRQAGNKTDHIYYNADFSSLKEVEIMAEKVLAVHDHLDILINNAGIGPGSTDARQQGDEGYELRFTVNYLAPLLLTTRLLPLLEHSAPTKIINVVSGAQATIQFDDIMLEKKYGNLRAYAQSKLALIMYTFDLAEEVKEKGVRVNCVHPATQMDTKLVREYAITVQSKVQDGVDSLLYVALSPETENTSGVYFDMQHPRKAIEQAYNKEARKRLKDFSMVCIDDALVPVPAVSEKVTTRVWY